MKMSSKLFYAAVEYQKKYLSQYKKHIYIENAARELRTKLTPEELKLENNYILCCEHFWKQFLDTQEPNQCEACIKEFGFQYFRTKEDELTGHLTSLHWSAYNRRNGGGETDFNFEDGENKPKKKTKTKKVAYADHAKLISINYKGKRALATVKNGLLVYNNKSYDKPQKAALAAMEDIFGSAITGYASKFWIKHEGEVAEKIEWSDKSIVTDPDGAPKRGRKSKAK